MTMFAPAERLTCRGRTVFASPAEALEDARERRATFGRRLRAFDCCECQGWHLGPRTRGRR